LRSPIAFCGICRGWRGHCGRIGRATSLTATTIDRGFYRGLRRHVASFKHKGRIADANLIVGRK
jgi:hypothetical protein